MCTQRDTHLAVLFTRLSCQLDVFHPKMIEAWRKPPQMPHSQFELTSCPFFIVSASPHFPPFYFPVPLHCLLPCMQYYYSFGSGCRPNASKSDIISEQLRHLNNREWAGLTSPVTLHWLNYLEKVAKIYLGAVFISTCSWILIKGVCAEQKTSPEQQLFLALTSRLTTDFIRPAQLGVRLIVGNCRSIVNLWLIVWGLLCQSVGCKGEHQYLLTECICCFYISRLFFRIETKISKKKNIRNFPKILSKATLPVTIFNNIQHLAKALTKII